MSKRRQSQWKTVVIVLAVIFASAYASHLLADITGGLSWSHWGYLLRRVPGSGRVEEVVIPLGLLLGRHYSRIRAFGLYYEYNGFSQLAKVRLDNSSGIILEEYLYDHEGNAYIPARP